MQQNRRFVAPNALSFHDAVFVQDHPGPRDHIAVFGHYGWSACCTIVNCDEGASNTTRSVGEVGRPLAGLQARI